MIQGNFFFLPLIFQQQISLCLIPCERLQFDNDNSFYKDDIIYERLIKFLSDFALKSRYYNLDTLTGREQKDIEPLERWDEEISSLILRRHYKPKKERLAEMSKMAEFLTPFTLIDHIADNGQPINSVHELFINSDMGKTKQKYSMYYLYVIIRFLSELYTCLEYEGKFYPYMREFFEIFTLEDRAKILRKKTWNPHPPYQF